MPLPPGAPAPTTRLKLDYSALMPIAPPGPLPSTVDFPPLLSLEELEREFAGPDAQAAEALRAILGEATQARMAAEREAARQETAYRGALAEPPPMIGPPPISPLVALGSLAAGNMASVLMGRPEVAQEAPRYLQGLQAEAYRTAQAGREQNLNLLLSNYAEARDLAKQAGQLEQSIKFGEKIKAIHDKRERQGELIKGQQQTRARRDELQTDLQTRLAIVQADANAANWRAMLDYLSKAGGGISVDDWMKHWDSRLASAADIKDPTAQRNFLSAAALGMPRMAGGFGTVLGYYANLRDNKGKLIFDKRNSEQLLRKVSDDDPMGGLYEALRTGRATEEEFGKVFNAGRPDPNIVFEFLKRPARVAGAAVTAGKPSRIQAAGKAVIGGLRQTTAPVRVPVSYYWQLLNLPPGEYPKLSPEDSLLFTPHRPVLER